MGEAERILEVNNKHKPIGGYQMRKNASHNLVNKVKTLRTTRWSVNRMGARVSSPNSGVRPGARALNLELPTSLGSAGISISLPAFVALLLGGLLLNLTFSNSAYAAFSASISRSGTVSIAEAGQDSIRPTSTGTLGTGSDKVSVTTNCTYGGYKLYVSATSTGGTNLKRYGADATELQDSSNYITTSTTATGSETTLSKDTWGVGKTASAFSGLPAYTADAGTLTAFYTGTSSSSYDFYYGVNVSTAKTPGTYTGEVLYTVLMDEACTKYTLNFDGNSATTNNLTSQDLDFDSTINLADISSTSKIARTGYTLTGWKDQNNKSYGITGTADVNPNDLATVTLTAQWQLNSHAVTVNKGSNVTTVSGANTYNYNSTVTITATAFATGYHFSGWTVNSGGVTLYSNSSMSTASTTSTPAYFRMPDNAVTVTASAAANTYTIAYDANGGSGTTPSSQSGTYGSSITTRANTFTRSGYEFKGWASTSGATTKTCDASATCSVTTLASNAGKTAASDNGATITLYAVWESSGPITMQSFSCNSLTAGTSTTLADARDGQEYTVYRFPTDVKYAGTSTVANVASKCIMTKDLNLGAKASVSGASSSITANGTMTLSPNDSGFTSPTGSGESITVPTSNVTVSAPSSWSGTDAYSNKQYKANGTGNYAGRGYYSWGAAMVVCPKNWRLPTADEYYTGSAGSWEVQTGGIAAIVKGSNATTTISNITGSPYSFVLGGYYVGSFNYATSRGYYWSSTQSSSTDSYRLYMGSSYGLLRNSSLKYGGFAVRCIAE